VDNIHTLYFITIGIQIITEKASDFGKYNLGNQRLQLCSMESIVKTHKFQSSFPSADKDSFDRSEYIRTSLLYS